MLSTVLFVNDAKARATGAGAGAGAAAFRSKAV